MLIPSAVRHFLRFHDQGSEEEGFNQGRRQHPASTFIAKALSRVQESERDYAGARKTLNDALRVLPGDKWLNGALARLIERHFPDEGREAESCWRRSFTDGDTNYTSQFWFARRLYVNGKIDDAMERFAVSSSLVFHSR